MGRKIKNSFDDFYLGIFGDRWEGLKQALLSETDYLEISDGLIKPYYMDKASSAAAAALGVVPGDSVLDMCAAPGGKTLLLALSLNGEGRLVSNDRSAERRRRLRSVISDCLPESLSRIIEISSHDATKWGLYEKNVYDKILLDAPCSSEAHVLSSPPHLAAWSPSRTKQLAVKQHAMLAAAADALKPGGTLVYSTCALSPLENDGVIEKLLKKRGGIIEAPGTEGPGEKTAYGRHILPDASGGCGPIYYAKLWKVSNDS